MRPCWRRAHETESAAVADVAHSRLRPTRKDRKATRCPFRYSSRLSYRLGFGACLARPRSCLWQLATSRSKDHHARMLAKRPDESKMARTCVCGFDLAWKPDATVPIMAGLFFTRSSAWWSASSSPAARRKQERGVRIRTRERSAVERPPRPATLGEREKKRRRRRRRKSGGLTGESRPSMPAGFSRDQLKSLSEQLASSRPPSTTRVSPWRPSSARLL